MQKNIRLLFVFMLLLLCVHCDARRRHSPPRPAEQFAVYTPVRIRVTPSGIINRFGKGLPVGAEYFFSRHFSVLADASIPFKTRINNSYNQQYEKDIQHEFRAAAQTRYYFGKRRDARWMIGGEGFFVQQAFREQYGEMHDSYYYRSYQSADVSKGVWGIAPFFGVDLHPDGRFCVEVRAGMGLKWIRINREQVTGLGQEQKLQGFFPTNEDQIESRGGLLYFPASISITYGIGRR